MLWIINYQDGVSRYFESMDKLKIVDTDDYTAEWENWDTIFKFVRDGVIHIENLYTGIDGYCYSYPADIFHEGVNILNDEVVVVVQIGLILVWYNNVLYNIIPQDGVGYIPYSYGYKTRKRWYISFNNVVLFFDKNGISYKVDNFTYKSYRVDKDYLIKRLLLCNDAQEVLNDIVSNTL